LKLVRTALFAPGSKERVMAKALESGAHAVILDLEDSVPIAAKAEARALVARAIDSASALPAVSRPVVTVRTNGAATGLLADDLTAVVRKGLDAIFLPKVESVEQMTGTASLLDRLEAALHRIMAQDQMAALEVEIREAMVYGAPKEMGALYSRTFQMRDVIKAEQDKARKKRDDESWQRKEKERLLNERQAYLLATFLFLLYLWILLGLLSRIGK